jgi:hypothetical protein
MSEYINTIAWLRENAVVAAQKDLKEKDYGDRVWILADHLVEKFIEKLVEQNDTFCNGAAKVNGLVHMYFTTYQGLVIIDPMGISSKDYVTMGKCRYLRPEILRSRWYTQESIYNKWMEGITTNFLVSRELERVEKVQKEQRELEEYKARCAAAIQRCRDMLPDNQTFQDLVTAAKNFDHTFEASDDHRYCMNTRARLRQLEADITACGVDGPEVIKSIFIAHGGWV